MPRLTIVACDMCGTEVYVGRHGDPLCTENCAWLRTRARTRDAQVRADLRDLLPGARAIDPEARMLIGRNGLYIAARVGGFDVRIEDPEDLDWITMDLDRAAA